MLGERNIWDIPFYLQFLEVEGAVASVYQLVIRGFLDVFLRVQLQLKE
jgi:hypothetical protein